MFGIVLKPPKYIVSKLQKNNNGQIGQIAFLQLETRLLNESDTKQSKWSEAGAYVIASSSSSSSLQILHSRTLENQKNKMSFEQICTNGKYAIVDGPHPTNIKLNFYEESEKIWKYEQKQKIKNEKEIIKYKQHRLKKGKKDKIWILTRQQDIKMMHKVEYMGSGRETLIICDGGSCGASFLLNILRSAYDIYTDNPYNQQGIGQQQQQSFISQTQNTSGSIFQSSNYSFSFDSFGLRRRLRILWILRNAREIVFANEVCSIIDTLVQNEGAKQAQDIFWSKEKDFLEGVRHEKYKIREKIKEKKRQKKSKYKEKKRQQKQKEQQKQKQKQKVNKQYPNKEKQFFQNDIVNVNPIDETASENIRIREQAETIALLNAKQRFQSQNKQTEEGQFISNSQIEQQQEQQQEQSHQQQKINNEGYQIAKRRISQKVERIKQDSEKGKEYMEKQKLIQEQKEKMKKHLRWRKLWCIFSSQYTKKCI
ncbi:MAG: hypothetical protein EZS28_031920 [Streblomastix strix]|uniref:Uncharacterized protein n=1 Tax=Streblomastix strix TaxID=222440 RepID=A0A5J4UQU7_9EUKA|nr:MAG: hypothetical protein EZS28_031920 [Streblomastix strix]